MSAKLIDGKSHASRIEGAVLERSRAFVRRCGKPPGLAVIEVGEHPASQIYVRNKIKVARRCEFALFQQNLPAAVTERELISTIERLNINHEVHGILLQLPLPRHILPQTVLDLIDPGKDVDGLGLRNLVSRQVWPCTARAVHELVRSCLTETSTKDLTGIHSVVVGRSQLVGKPTSELLQFYHSTVTVCHSRTRDLERITSLADVLVVAAGVPDLIGPDHVKSGAVVIDVGINSLPDGRLVGDVNFEAVATKAKAITPVPGGVGPMTVAMLMLNLIELAEGSKS